MENINVLVTSSTVNKCVRAANPLSAWSPLLFLLYPSVQQQETHSCLHMVSQGGHQTIRTEKLPPELTDRVVGRQRRIPKFLLCRRFKRAEGPPSKFQTTRTISWKTKASRWRHPALANKGVFRQIAPRFSGLMKPGLTFLALIQSVLFGGNEELQPNTCSAPSP